MDLGGLLNRVTQPVLRTDTHEYARDIGLIDLTSYCSLGNMRRVSYSTNLFFRL